MRSILFLGIFLYLPSRGYAVQCFGCHNVSSPHDCTKVIECNTNEQCYMEQILLHDGSVTFNIGCMNSSRCLSARYGKRLIDKRWNGITVCFECCKNNFCNRIGCGTNEIPATQRGPYCFSCDAAVDAKTCSNITVCNKDELCMLTSPVQYANLPQTIYRGECGTKPMCDVVTHLPSESRCTPMCCNSDFCNDHCGIPHHVTKTTPLLQPTGISAQPENIHTSIVTTETTKGYTVPTTSKQPFHCNTMGNYKHLRTETVDLCVHVVIHRLNFNDARIACNQESAHLVILDTHEKSLLLRGELAGHDHRVYWIGAQKSNDGDQFSWMNHYSVAKSEADWGDEQDQECNVGQQDCVAMVKHHYKWTACHCDRRSNYICER